MKSRKHLEAVAALPCCVCGAEPVQAHHLKGLKYGTGMGLKACDTKTIPLCYAHHHEFHTLGVKTWEARYGEQGMHLANTLEKLKGSADAWA